MISEILHKMVFENEEVQTSPILTNDAEIQVIIDEEQSPIIVERVKELYMPSSMISEHKIIVEESKEDEVISPNANGTLNHHQKNSVFSRNKSQKQIDLQNEFYMIQNEPIDEERPAV